MVDAPARPGRPARLSRDGIVEAALAGGDLDTLTVRELAARLGVSHGALYRWVSNRDQLFDLINEAMVERIMPSDGPPSRQWRPWLAGVAWAMHDHWLSVPGYVSRLSRPHRHTTAAFGALRDRVVAAFAQAGVSPELAEQSWYIFITSVVSWLAVQENPLDLGRNPPRFDLFLGALLAGLPAREPGMSRPVSAG